MSESKWREMVAEVLADHEPFGGGWFCHCTPEDEDGVRDRLSTTWENHLADALSPVLAQMKREWQAEALREFARKWGLWVVQGAPQIRGGAAYRAICEAREIESAEASGQEGER